MRKQLFIESSSIDRRDGPGSSILLDGAAGDYFKSKDAWLPEVAGAQNNDTRCDFTISWWAKNTKPEGEPNAAGLWTIFAVASDETDVSGNLIDNHDNKGFSLHCIDEGDGDLKLRLHIRNESSLSVTTGSRFVRGDTQVFSYDVVPDNNTDYNSGFPFDEAAGRFDELFNDGEWHLYEVTLANGVGVDTFELAQFSVQLTIDMVDIRPSNIKLRFNLNPQLENVWWDPEAATPSIQRAPLHRGGVMPEYLRLWMGTLYGDDGDDGGDGAMSMQLYSIIYSAGTADGASLGMVFPGGSPSDGAHGATPFPNNAFNGHYYDETGTSKLHGFYTWEHQDNQVAPAVSLGNLKTATQWWRPGFDKNNIGKDYIEFLGGQDFEGRIWNGMGGNDFATDDTNAIRYSDFEVHGMTAASIRRDAPGGFGDDSSIVMNGALSEYFKSAASLSDVQSSTLIWWAKNTKPEGDPDADGLWTVFSIGTGLGDRDSFSLRCTGDDRIRLYIRDHTQDGGTEKILKYDHRVLGTPQFNNLFGGTSGDSGGGWHMYAVALNVTGMGILDEVVFSIDGVEIPEAGSTSPTADITRGTFLSAPTLWMGNNFGGGDQVNGSMSMKLYSIIYAEGFASTNKLFNIAYRKNGDVIDNHWPAFNSEIIFGEGGTDNLTFPSGEKGRDQIPPMNWWRPGYDETNIGKDYEGSADFEVNGMTAASIRRDYPKP